MPYTNVDIFLEKGVKSVGESLNFMEKRVKKIIVDFFYSHLIQN
jgi:hypothetical protein